MKKWFTCVSAQEDTHVPRTILDAAHGEERNGRSSPRRHPDPHRQPAPALSASPKDSKSRSSPSRPPASEREAAQRLESAGMSRNDVPSRSRTVCQRSSGSEVTNTKSLSRRHSASDSTLAVREDAEVQVLLIGKTGNGKSTTGNAILGRSKPVFEVSTGILSATEHTQLGESVRKHGKGKTKVQVVDFPDVTCDMDEKTTEQEVTLCKTLTFPYPSAVCLVVRADVRFTPEEYVIYQRTRELLGRRVHDKNMVVIFTMGDKLPADERTFEEQLLRANRDLQQVLQDAGGRYVVFANGSRDGDSSQADNDRERKDVTRLFDIIDGLHTIQAVEVRPLSALLVGCPGTGKSATGNSILNANPIFEVHMSLSRVTKDCEAASSSVRGFKLEIVDTPGINFREVDDQKVQHWFARFKSGPSVLIFVIRVDVPFEIENFDLFKELKRVIGSDVNKHVIVVFTRGDHLARNHVTIDNLLKEAQGPMKTLLAETDNRYVVFDNTTTSATEKLLQRNRLLEAMAYISRVNKERNLKVAPPRRPPQPRYIHSPIPRGGRTVFEQKRRKDSEGSPVDRDFAPRKQSVTAASDQGQPWLKKCTIS